MRKSVLVVIALMIIAIGVVWWGMEKGGWFKEKKFGPGESQTEGEGPGAAITREMTKEGGEKPKEEGAFKRGLAIKVYKCTRSTFEDVLPAMGSIKGLITRKLNFETGGLVEAVNFREGDLVKKGSIMAQLQQKDSLLKIDYNQARLKSAMTALSQAEKRVKLTRQLFEIGAIIELKLSEVETEAATAKHQMEAAQVELDSARQELTKTVLVAPADCVLSDRNLEVGEVVTGNTQKAFEVVDINTVFAEIGVVERDVTRIKVGQLSRVYVDAYPDLPFDGIIDNIYPTLSEKTRTLPAEIKIDNARRMLMPGMFARTEIILFEKPGVISIPRVCLKKVEDTLVVYVVDEKTNTTLERLIETGYESTDYVEVTRGLREDDLVVISNIEELTAGTPVQVTEIQVREM